MKNFNNYNNAIAFISIFLFTVTTVSAQKFWLTAYSFPGGPKTAITIAQDSCIFVGTVDKVLRSCDNNFSWDTTLNSNNIFSLFTAGNGRILAGGAGLIFYTNDNGDTWDSVALKHTYPVTKFIQTNDGDIFAITGILDIEKGFVGAGVYYSDNNGKQWEQRNNGLGDFLSCEQIATDRNGRIYLAVADELVTGNAGLCYSDNKGQLWQNVLIKIDGKNVIDNTIKIGNTFGLSVSLDDSVHISISGTAENVGVTLNLHKSIYDITKNSMWNVNTISNTSIWWNDRLLNNIHFAKNGDWYSSIRGSLNTGGTFFSKNKGQTWNRHIEGLGLDFSGIFNKQIYAENEEGRIYMIQLMDERIYWADTSVVTSVKLDSENSFNPFILAPNPAGHNNMVWVKSDSSSNYDSITLTNVLGKVILHKSLNNSMHFNAPESRGLYFVTIRNIDGSTHTQVLFVN